ncbi:hypothetical protein CAEBREN_07770 [Caenorhabditis brenneri]|uniref:non-specific serine/threonine protein kinase n=1 Tax=Caenorhabditis brenneri TaxID=135651 RepID=G0NWI4_CAEBE|nr:hypothetical protein CAEBREN_07770 [Caenorhabditis brenneri]
MSSTVNRIVKVLGEGSFGKVFLVENTTDPSRKMAMKKMLFKEEGVKELIESECRVHEHLSRIGHENLVKMLGVVTIKTTSCIYLEYIAGGELRGKIKKNGMSLQKAKFYFRQLVDGLHFLHQNHVVHRDIKPQNLLLTELDDLKIADFGLSTFYRNEDGEEKMLDGFWGTRPYGSPEMFKMEAYRGPPVDVWSAGIVLVYMLSGKLPWEAATDLSLEYVLWTNGVRREPWSKMHEETIDFLKKMLNPCVEDRATIEQIKEDPWLATDVRPIRSVKRKVGNKNGDVQGMETRAKRQRLEA